MSYITWSYETTKKTYFCHFPGFVRVGGTAWNTLNGLKKKRGEEKQRFLKRRGKLGQGMDALKKRGAGIPLRYYDVSIYIVAGFFIYFYLLFISHWPLSFCNNIAIHCKMYANLSQQLHTIKTN